MLRANLALGFLVALCGVSTAVAEELGNEEHGEYPVHVPALFLGYDTETGHEHNETGFALGLEYELRLSTLWGTGALLEALIGDAGRGVFGGSRVLGPS